MGWLTGWTYRKTITLSRATGAVTLYQMKVLVGESSGSGTNAVHCEGHALSSFNDLRFTASDGTTLLDYWIESISGTTPNQVATVWIEFDSIGTGATTFYMYYGNSGASAVSSLDATMIFGDSFNGSSIDGTKWSNFGDGTGSRAEGSGLFTGSLTATQAGWKYMGIVHTFAQLTGYRIITKFRGTGQTGNNGNKRADVALYDNQGTPATYLLNVGKDTSNAAFKGCYCTTDGNIIAEAYTSGTYILYEFQHPSASKLTIFMDGTQKYTTTTPRMNNLTSLQLWASNNAVSTDLPTGIDVDYLYITKFVVTEPAWGTWSAEGSLLTVADLAHADSLGAPALTQVHNLSVANLDNSHALGGVSLSQAYNLIVNSLSHAHSLDNLVLTQVHNLLVNNLSHAHSLDLLTLTQNIQLVVNSLSHANAIDDVTITIQMILLVVQGLSHGHSISDFTLSQVHRLAVQAMNHLQSVGGVSLSQIHNLLVQSLSHLHAADNVLLAQEYLLIVEALLHTHKLDEVKLKLGVKLTDDFKYRFLRPEIIPPGTEGDLSYGKIKADKPELGPEGDFKYKRLKN